MTARYDSNWDSNWVQGEVVFVDDMKDTIQGIVDVVDNGN